MWYFNSPEIIYGEDALSYLDELRGQRAFIVTDPVLHQLGFTEIVAGHLRRAGLAVAHFAEVEPEPSLQTIERGAAALRAFAADWIVGLGGGSAMDAAKAMWLMYERPDFKAGEIDPASYLGLGKYARLLTIPTTAGTGAEVSFAAVLTDSTAGRKIELPSRELMASLVIVDPSLTAALPAHITADTGIDALSHAIDGYLSTWHNDFSDGLCLRAMQLIFANLRQAVKDGSDRQAREKMANAATIAGLGMTNAHIALTHALGHALGSTFRQSHGRCVGLALPYFIEFEANSGRNRVVDLAEVLKLPADGEPSAGRAVAGAVRDLMRSIGQPTCLAEMGIAEADFAARLEHLCDLTEADVSIATTLRIPQRQEIALLYRYAYEGCPVDF